VANKILEGQLARQSGAVWRGALFALLVVLCGCETGPPVQEMSDARQAIAVARQAGAAQFSPDEFRAAESFLDSAQRKLAEHAYAQARSDAVEAKNRAIAALENTENSSQQKPPQ
jgi:hypothetical protein